MTRLSRFRYRARYGDLLGAHVSAAGGAHTIFERARAIGASSVALFSKNSNQWKARDLSDEEISLFRSEWKKSRIGPVVIHAAYLINLAATNRSFIEKSVHAMTVELIRAERLGITAVVLHPGAHMGAGIDKGLERIARSLDRIHAKIPDCRAMTLLETSAGQGSSLGCSFEELGRIIRLVDDPGRLGVCIDTCHIFSAGYDIRTMHGWERTIDEVDRHVGIERVGAFHVNDSKRELGARVDRHAEIGKGTLGLDAFGFLVNDRRFARIPKILETPKPEKEKSDIRGLKMLRRLRGGSISRDLSRNSGEGRSPIDGPGSRVNEAQDVAAPAAKQS